MKSPRKNYSLIYMVTPTSQIVCAIDEKDPDLMKCILDYLQFFNPNTQSIMSRELLHRLTNKWVYINFSFGIHLKVHL